MPIHNRSIVTLIDGVERTHVLALSDGSIPEVQGMVNVRFKDADFALICELFVRPELRKQGIARALMDKAEDIAMRKGCVSVSLTVMLANLATLKPYYERRGYRAVYQFTDGDVLFTKGIA